MVESCLTNRIRNYIDLTEREAAFVARAEKDERALERRDPIFAAGAPMNELMLLKFGWAVVRGASIRRRRPILRIYLPGEIIGLSEISRGEVLHAIHMQTDGAVCPFPRSAIPDLYRDTPRLAALFTALESADHQRLREQLQVTLSADAMAKVAYLLLTLFDRLSLAGGIKSKRFRLPFSQGELGDAVGLTGVYVNGILKDLRETGLIEMRDQHVTILDAEALERKLGFTRMSLAIANEWFPDPDT